MEPKVKSLYLYPVKSLGYINLNTAELSKSGIEYDRNWMLINEAGEFMTQRKYPQMALIKTQISNHQLQISYNGSSITVPAESAGEEFEPKVWGEKTHGREVSKEISNWLSERLGVSSKLLHFSSMRPVKGSEESEIPFTDAAPFLLIGEESLLDLNSRMNTNLSMLRFRPNIVVSCTEPYEEDGWKELRIGNSRFKVLKKCARCQLPNVNPDTGQVDQNVLKFLSTYRKAEDNYINFGIHLSLIEGNEINVNDKVEIVS